MNLLAASTPHVSDHFLDMLYKAFPRIEVTPATDINEVMFSAGEQKVLDWIKRKTAVSLITGGS